MRPGDAQLGATVSRSQLWFTRPPDLSSVLALPGSLVRIQHSPVRSSLGIYVCPADGVAGQNVFCLDSRSLQQSLTIFANVDPLLQTLARTSVLTADLFCTSDMDLVTQAHSGSPSKFDDDFGLAHPEWLAALRLARIPMAPSPYADLPDLAEADSDDENLVVTVTAPATAPVIAPPAGTLTATSGAPSAAALRASFAGHPPGLTVDTGAHLDMAGTLSPPPFTLRVVLPPPPLDADTAAQAAVTGGA